MSDKEIAKALNISPHTVSQHIRDARIALGATSRREARRNLPPNQLHRLEGIPEPAELVLDHSVDADTMTVSEDAGSEDAKYALYGRLGRWQTPPRILGSVSPLILVLALLVLLVLGGGLALMKLLFEIVQLMRL